MKNKKSLSIALSIGIIISMLLVGLLPLYSYAYESYDDIKMSSELPQDLYDKMQGRWERVGGHYGGAEVDTSYYIIEGTTAYLYLPQILDNKIIGFEKYTYLISYVSEGYGNSLFADDNFDGYGHYYEIKIGNNSLYRIFDEQPDMLVAIWYEKGELHMSGTSSYWKDTSYNSKVDVTGVSVTPASSELTVGGMVQLQELISPYNATNQQVSWSSSNSSVATVTDFGLVQGLSVGSTIITVKTADGGYEAECQVNVVDKSIDVNEMTISSTEAKLNLGDTLYLKVWFPDGDTWREAGFVDFYNKTCSYKLESINHGDIYSANTWTEYVFRITAEQVGVTTFQVESYKTGEKKSCVITVGTPDPTPDPDPTSSVTMYRLYNPNNGEHFYTSDASGKNMLISIGWDYEGVAWIAPTSGNPVYKLYNPNSGEHFYTTKVQERDALTPIGWEYEGVGWYSSISYETPVYRLYNPNAKGQFEAGSHFYTTKTEDRDVLINAGWRYEGIAWYGL